MSGRTHFLSFVSNPTFNLSDCSSAVFTLERLFYRHFCALCKRPAPLPMSSLGFRVFAQLPSTDHLAFFFFDAPTHLVDPSGPSEPIWPEPPSRVFFSFGLHPRGTLRCAPRPSSFWLPHPVVFVFRPPPRCGKWPSPMPVTFFSCGQCHPLFPSPFFFSIFGPFPVRMFC